MFTSTMLLARTLFNKKNLLLACFLSSCSHNKTPEYFAKIEAPKIIKILGGNEKIISSYDSSIEEMLDILNSEMVQRMKNNNLSKLEWDQKYMQADVIYIHKLGQELEKRAELTVDPDKKNIMILANMFLGYEKHFERLKKYGLSATDKLSNRECDEHIKLLSTDTTMNEYYVAILTDMIPYVIFANYLNENLREGDIWKEYAQKYGDLNNKYAREKLAKSIELANQAIQSMDPNKAKELFLKGFKFEKYFIKEAFQAEFKIS